MGRVYLITLFLLAISCESLKLPTEVVHQYEYSKSYRLENNQLKIEIKNPLYCPLRVWMFHDNKELQNRFSQINPIELQSRSDTVLVFYNVDKIENGVNFSSRLGSLNKKIEMAGIELPFPENRRYRVIQGNNTNYTHNSDWSRYAVDFNLKTNDTISAATNGYVVGVVDAYKHGGKEEKWKPFGNYITIYDTQSGIFTQYVHLVKDGSLVKVGDQIVSGQPIGLSGKTGQTDIEHLHFNCLVPENSNYGLKSVPYKFKEGYDSQNLNKNDVVKK